MTAPNPRPKPEKISIEIVSDFVCPWCLVGHVRLERALEIAGLAANDVRIKWLPFELNRQMPEGGADRKEYLIQKFGSAEKLAEIEANMKQVGEQDGIPFRQDLIKRSPNTFKAHRLLWLADKEGKAHEFAHRVFLAYFTEGQDIGDEETLAKLAAESGLDAKKAEAFLKSDEGTSEVRALENEVLERGIRMVPNFTIGDQTLKGAHQPDIIAEMLQAARVSLS